MKKHQDFLTEKEQERLYLAHHMHHLKSGMKNTKHELHHCFLFSRKNMRGSKHKMIHLILDGKLFHVLNKLYSGILFDHLDRPFTIKVAELNGKKYSIVK